MFSPLEARRELNCKSTRPLGRPTQAGHNLYYSKHLQSMIHYECKNVELVVPILEKIFFHLCIYVIKQPKNTI